MEATDAVQDPLPIGAGHWPEAASAFHEHSAVITNLLDDPR
jgi:hypothetical protein